MVDSKDVEEIIKKVSEEKNRLSDNSEKVLNWLLNREGEMFNRKEVITEISNSTKLSQKKASKALASVVGDIVDPVQQIPSPEGNYVGIIKYQEYPEKGAYGYIDYNDKYGKRKRIVCAKCVQQVEYDEQVTHATQGQGTCSKNETWSSLLNKINKHYQQEHKQTPRNIEIGASLISGTTIAGNTTIHGGNQSNFNIEAFGTASSTDGQVPKVSNGSIVMESVNGGGEVINNSVSTYEDLPLPASSRQITYVSDENDVVVPTNSNLSKWKSLLDGQGVVGVPNREVDYFEDQDLSEYTYTSASGSFYFSSKTANSGNYSLAGSHATGNPRIVSTSGLSNYPSRGDNVAWYVNLGNVSDVGCGVSLLTDGKTEEEGYRFEVGRTENKGGNEMAIIKEKSNSYDNLNTTAASISSGEWYEIEVRLGSESLTMTIYQVDSTGNRKDKIAGLKASDSEYTSGGVRISLSVASGGGTSYFDNIRTT